MSPSVKHSDQAPDTPAATATAMKIAQGSRTMLNLVEGRPEFERLASLLDRARSEALRVLHLHGLAAPPIPCSPGEPKDDDAQDRDGSPTA